MRIIAAILIWILLMGGMLWYMQEPEVAVSAVGYQTEAAVGHFVLEVTPSFGAEADPFALDIEEVADATTLRVRLNGEEVLSRRNTLAPGMPVVLDPAPGLIVGLNEFYLEAAPPLETAQQAHALRVRVLQDGMPLAEKTLWSAPGERIADTMTLDMRVAVSVVEEDADEH